jgi:predicted RNA-binding Zn-ribbon protein involved in translation (DUF1610 family)
MQKPNEPIIECLDTPKTVCLCGSTQFWREYQLWGLKYTLAGWIVLSIGVASPDAIVWANPNTDEGKEQKRRLDELHKRKIDMADEVFVLNVDGYIGESTRSEIDHATAQGKPVRYLEQRVFCWNCNGIMRQFAHDSFYYHYRCPACGKERLVLRGNTDAEVR